MRKLAASLAVCFCLSLVANAQSPQKVKTKYKVDFFPEANYRAGKIATIPGNVILEKLDESGGYLKVAYKNKIGWVFKVEVERVMEVPAPDLKIRGVGYKIISGVYRYFFGLMNEGTLAYRGKVTLRLFDKSGKVVFEKTTDFSSEPILPGSGGTFPIDTEVEAPEFEFEHSGGKVRGSTGRFIERL